MSYVDLYYIINLFIISLMWVFCYLIYRLSECLITLVNRACRTTLYFVPTYCGSFYSVSASWKCTVYDIKISRSASHQNLN